MKTRKFLAFALAAIMALSASISVSAANITADGGSQNVTVSYGAAQGFTVTIPSDFTIDTATNKATAEVSASNVLIPHGSKLDVAVSGHDYVDSWELVDQVEATNSLTYTIGTTEGAADIANNGVVLSVPAATAEGTATMYFTVVDTLTKAGTYQDTLTFTVGVNSAEVKTTATVTVTGYADRFGEVRIPGHGTYNGMEYGSDVVLELTIGTVIECYVVGEGSQRGIVKVNGTEVYSASGSGTYDYVVNGDVTISVDYSEVEGTEYYYENYTVINITER